MNGKQNGFTYIFVLILLFLMGLGLAGAGKMWSIAAQREKEEELLFRGNQIKVAIENYYYSGHGGGNFFPKKLEDLLKDARSFTVKRYLRKVYKDPMTLDGEWELILDQGRVKGVRSKSEKEPFKKKNFPEEYKHFENKKKYKEWDFIFSSRKRG